MNYDQQSLEEQRKTINDQLKQLDGQLSKVTNSFMQELQDQYNRNIKTRNALLMASRTSSPYLNHCGSKSDSRSSSLSLCSTRPSAKKSSNLSSSSSASCSKTNSLQSLPTTQINMGTITDPQPDKEVFY